MTDTPHRPDHELGLTDEDIEELHEILEENRRCGANQHTNSYVKTNKGNQHTKKA